MSGLSSTLDLQEDSSLMPAALGKAKSKSKVASAAAAIAPEDVTFSDNENIDDRKTLNEKG